MGLQGPTTPRGSIGTVDMDVATPNHIGITTTIEVLLTYVNTCIMDIFVCVI